MGECRQATSHWVHNDQIYVVIRPQWINSCHADFYWGNMKIYLYFLNIEVVQVVEILPHVMYGNGLLSFMASAVIAGDTRSQAISSHGIDQVIMEYSGFSSKRNNTFRPEENVCHSAEKIFVWLTKIYWILFLVVQLTSRQHWFSWWLVLYKHQAIAEINDYHDLWQHIYAFRPQCINIYIAFQAVNSSNIMTSYKKSFISKGINENGYNKYEVLYFHWIISLQLQYKLMDWLFSFIISKYLLY